MNYTIIFKKILNLLINLIKDEVLKSANTKEIDKVISPLIDKEGAYHIQNVNTYDSRLKN